MKRSDIRRMIREEMIKELRSLNEAFGDPVASKLNKMTGMDGRLKNFWRSAAKTYDIAWDKLPKGSFRKVSTSDPAIKKQMAFWIATSPKQTGGSYSWDSIQPGVVAVTINGKVQYYQGSYGQDATIGPKGASRYQGYAVGQGKRGTLQLKKLPEYSDFVYVFDLESYRGGTTELKAKRAELKLGKDKFTDHKAWKKSNIDRYKAMLADKVGSRGTVEKMVGEIVKIANTAIEEAMSVVKTNEYGEMVTAIAGNEVKVDTVTRYMSKALDRFARYVSAENSQAKFLKKYPEYNTEDSWEKRNMREIALDIKNIYNEFKNGRFKYS